VKDVQNGKTRYYVDCVKLPKKRARKKL
jgi:hypothetical protein